jgi:DNA adenine methylase
MKTPINYYGGKQNLVKTILPLIPGHTCYVEPFFGGGAIFFAKEPSKVEVINDINEFAINFYKTVQQNYDKLKALLDITLYSRKQYKEARNIFKHQKDFTDVEKAWAFWVLSNESYPGKWDCWGFTRYTNSIPINIKNKIHNFTIAYCDRLRLAYIECDDALKVIKRFDSEKTFFYIDPPYFNSDCGIYKGYSIDDYENLLQLLSTIKGKFLLSSYPSDILEGYKNKNNWNDVQINKFLYMSNNLKEQRQKTEALVKNYILENKSSFTFFERLDT